MLHKLFLADGWKYGGDYDDQAVLLERTLQTNKKVIAENKSVTADCHVKSRKSKFPKLSGKYFESTLMF